MSDIKKQICICGSVVANLKVHYESKKHKKFIENQKESDDTPAEKESETPTDTPTDTPKEKQKKKQKKNKRNEETKLYLWIVCSKLTKSH